INSLSLTGDNAAAFKVIEAPTTPFTLQPEEKFTIKVQFDPAADAPLGVETAVLRFARPDPPVVAPLELPLRGLPTAGEFGASEPSLQRIFDLFELPDTVGDND